MRTRPPVVSNGPGNFQYAGPASEVFRSDSPMPAPPHTLTISSHRPAVRATLSFEIQSTAPWNPTSASPFPDPLPRSASKRHFLQFKANVGVFPIRDSPSRSGEAGRHQQHLAAVG